MSLDKIWEKSKKGKTYYNNYYTQFYHKRTGFINRFKNKPCADCQGWFEPCQMDFDHRDSKKKVKSISDMQYYSVKQILKEIAKCDLVCSNCHRLRTYKRRQKNATI